MATVLLVEPHDELLSALSLSLAAMGHRVHRARSGSAAASVGSGLPGPIDLLVTEVELPDFSGVFLVDHLASLRPDLPVLLTSWQKREHLRALGHEVRDLPFLKKPLRLHQFQARVRGLLPGSAQTEGRTDAPSVGERDLPCPRQGGG